MRKIIQIAKILALVSNVLVVVFFCLLVKEGGSQKKVMVALLIPAVNILALGLSERKSARE